MAASTITRVVWTDGAAGTVVNNARKNSDLYDKIDQMVAGAGAYATLTLGGKLSVEGFGDHAFSSGGTGAQSITVRNSTAGTTNYAALVLGNDGDAAAGNISHTSSSYTAATYIPQDGLVVHTHRVGGISIAATHASGTLRLYTGGTTERVRLDADGNLAVGHASSSGRRLVVVGAGTATTAGITTEDGDGKTEMLLVSSTTANAGEGGGIEFGFGYGSSTQPYFANIRAYAIDGNGNTKGDLVVGTRFSTADSALTEVIRFGADSCVYINDTSNAKVTRGLTINQGGADDEILSFKSDDVSHNMTSSTEANTYGSVRKHSATAGGMHITGYCEAGIAVALTLSGFTGGPDTTRSTSATAAVQLNAAGWDAGTSITSMGTNANLVAIRDNGMTRFIFDSDGDSHQDVGTAWTNFDEFDDVALLTAISAGVSRTGDPLRRAFGHVLRAQRAQLERARIVTFNRDGHHFVNWSRMNMLTVGAVRQLGTRQASQAQELADLRRRLERLEEAA